MLKKFLRDSVIIVVGKQAEQIADLLNIQKHVNEFLIAKKLNITINQTRNILYKLADNGLVSNIRKKDKKKGWYTYFWKIEVLKTLEFLRNILYKKIEQLNNQIKSRETKDFYICERCDIEFNEENALINNFICSECGGVFSLKDKEKVLREFRKEFDKLKKDLNLVDEEIAKEKEKDEKKRFKESKKFKKEKDRLNKLKREMAKKKSSKNQKIIKQKYKKKQKEKKLKKKKISKKSKKRKTKKR